MFNEKPNNQYIKIEELISIIAEKNEIPEMLVMEYLPGQEICVDVLADSGETLFCSTRVGTVINSIMVSSEVKYIAEAADMAQKVVKLLSLDGNIDFDMKYGSDGFPYVMEINPRLPAGVAVQTAAGINFPYLRIKQLLGEELPHCTITEGYTMQFINREVLYAPDGTLFEWLSV